MAANFLAHVTNAGKFITDGVQKFNEFKKKHLGESQKSLKFAELLDSKSIRDFVDKTDNPHLVYSHKTIHALFPHDPVSVVPR